MIFYTQEVGKNLKNEIKILWAVDEVVYQPGQQPIQLLSNTVYCIPSKPQQQREGGKAWLLSGRHSNSSQLLFSLFSLSLPHRDVPLAEEVSGFHRWSLTNGTSIYNRPGKWSFSPFKMQFPLWNREHTWVSREGWFSACFNIVNWIQYNGKKKKSFTL